MSITRTYRNFTAGAIVDSNPLIVEEIVGDLEIPCDICHTEAKYGRPKDTEPAEWACIKVCCGQLVLLCDPCKEDRMPGVGPEDSATECVHCGWVFLYDDTVYLSIERLDRRSS